MPADDTRFSGNLSLAVLFVLAVAFLIRFIFVCQWFNTPYGEMPYLDAQVYDLWARDILQGHWTPGRAFYQSPLYPYALALGYAVFGASAWTAAFLNAVLGSATCALLAFVGGRYFGVIAGLATGVLAAFYAPFVFYSVPVLKESLELFLLALFLLFALRGLERNRGRDLFLGGVWLGLAVLARGNLAFLGAAVLLPAVIRWKKTACRNCGLFVLGVVLAVLPVTIHNAWFSHDFVPITYAGGFNFYVGNRIGANGGNAYPAEVKTGSGEEESTTQKAEADAGHALKPSEISAYWMWRGIDFVLDNPDKEFGLILRKAGLFFSGTEIPDNYNIGFFTRHMESLLEWPLPGFALVFGAAVLGIIAGGRKRLMEKTPYLIFAGAYLLSVLPFYVTDRYRLPVVVFLLPLAGAGVAVAAELIKAKRWKRLSIAGAVGAIFCAASLSFPAPTITSETIGWTGLSDIAFTQGKNADGLRYLYKAIDLSPQDVGAYFYMKGVYAEDRFGRHDKALQLLEEGKARHSDEAEAMREGYRQFEESR